MKAPDFTLQDTNGTQITLKDFRGSFVLLIFFPRINDALSLKELVGLTDLFEAFVQESTRVLAITGDNQILENSDRQFPFPVLFDENGVVCRSYSAWGLDALDEEKIGTLRFTFIISPTGLIVKQYTTIDSISHATQLLADLQKIKSQITPPNE